MSLLKPFDPEHAEFPDEGNLIGYFDGDVPVRLPDRNRVFRSLLVTGAGAKMERWIAGLMARDADRNSDMVVCLDPGGRYAEAFAQWLDKTDARRVVWIDLNAAFETGYRGAGRVISLNSCDPFGQNDPASFEAFRRFLLEQLAPLSAEAQAALGFALDSFHRAVTREADRAFTLSAVLCFLQDRAYRRYILSGLHTALLGPCPSAAAFERAAPEITTKLRPVFAEPVWRASLGVGTASSLTKLKPAPIIIATGAALAEESLPAQLWRFALFSHLATLASDMRSGVRLYGFGAAALDNPALDLLLAGAGGRETMLTLARDAYGESGHRPRLLFDREIAFEPDPRRLLGHVHARGGDDLLFVQPDERGGPFTMTLPPEPGGRTPRSTFPKLIRKHSAAIHGRALLYPLMEIDRLVTACDRNDAFYDAIDIPPPIGWRAEFTRTTGALPEPAKHPATLIDNPFRRRAA